MIHSGSIYAVRLYIPVPTPMQNEIGKDNREAISTSDAKESQTVAYHTSKEVSPKSRFLTGMTLLIVTIRNNGTKPKTP